MDPADRLVAARAALRLDPRSRHRLQTHLQQSGPARRQALEIVTLIDPADRPVPQAGAA
jgi:hypothetical protein